MPDYVELINGFNRFHKHYYKNNPDLYKKLTEQGQSPKIMLITCSDSRIAVDLLTDTVPGDLFLMRNVANLVPAYKDATHNEGTVAAIEFAVCDLKVENVIVMGHSQCGGIKALVGGETIVSRDSHVSQWVQVFDEAKQETEERFPNLSFDEKCTACEKISLKHSIEHLKTYPWIEEAMKQNKLKLHAWYFELVKGELYEIDDEGKANLIAPTD